MRDSGDIGKPVLTRGIFDGLEEGFRPFMNSQFTESFPSFATAHFFIFLYSVNNSSGIESFLPTLATDYHDFLFAIFFRMVTDNVDITVIGILFAVEVGMVLAWPELDIMLDEITFVDEMLFHDLLKYIFFVCQCDLPLIDSYISFLTYARMTSRTL